MTSTEHPSSALEQTVGSWFYTFSNLQRSNLLCRLPTYTFSLVFITFHHDRKTKSDTHCPISALGLPMFPDYPQRIIVKPGLAVGTWYGRSLSNFNPSACFTCVSHTVLVQHVTTRLVPLLSNSLTQQRAGGQRSPGAAQNPSFWIPKS